MMFKEMYVKFKTFSPFLDVNLKPRGKTPPKSDEDESGFENPVFKKSTELYHLQKSNSLSNQTFGHELAIKEESPTGCHSTHFNGKEIIVSYEPRHNEPLIVENSVAVAVSKIFNNTSNHSLRKSEERKSSRDISIESTRVGTPEHFVYGNTARTLMQRSKVISPERGQLSQTEHPVKIADNNCRSKSDDDLSPIVQLEKKPNDFSERRHSADDRDKKGNLTEKKNDISTENSKTTNGRRRLRDDTPSSTGSGDTQFCCPIPTNISLLKLRSRTSKPGSKRKSKENVTIEPNASSKPDCAYSTASEVNRKMPKTEEPLAPLAVVEELTESFESLASKMKDDKTSSVQELPCKVEEIWLREEGIENVLKVGSFAKDNRRKKEKEKIVTENDEVVSEDESIPSLEFRSKSSERNNEAESFEEVLTTVISKQIQAKYVSKEKHPSAAEEKNVAVSENGVDEENTPNDLGNKNLMEQTTQEEIFTIDNLEECQHNKLLNDETNKIDFVNEPLQFDNKTITKEEKMSEEVENKISFDDSEEAVDIKHQSEPTMENQDNASTNEINSKTFDINDQPPTYDSKLSEENVKIDDLDNNEESTTQFGETETETLDNDYTQEDTKVKEIENKISAVSSDVIAENVDIEYLLRETNEDEKHKTDLLIESIESKPKEDENTESIQIGVKELSLKIFNENSGKTDENEDTVNENIFEQGDKYDIQISSDNYNENKETLGIQFPDFEDKDAELKIEISAEIELSKNENENLDEETVEQEFNEMCTSKEINEIELMNVNTKSITKSWRAEYELTTEMKNPVLVSKTSASIENVSEGNTVLDSGNKNENVELKINDDQITENYQNEPTENNNEIISSNKEIKLTNETKINDSEVDHTTQPPSLMVSANPDNQYLFASEPDKNTKNTDELEIRLSEKDYANQACTTPDFSFLGQLDKFTDFSSTSSLETIIDAREAFKSQTSQKVIDDVTHNLIYDDRKEVPLILEEPVEFSFDVLTGSKLNQTEIISSSNDLVDEGFESIEPDIQISLTQTLDQALFYAHECQEETPLITVDSFVEPTTSAAIDKWSKTETEHMEQINFVSSVVMTFQDNTSESFESIEKRTEEEKSTFAPSAFLLGGNQQFEELQESKSLVQMTENKYSNKFNNENENEDSDSNSEIEESRSQSRNEKSSSLSSSRCNSIELIHFIQHTEQNEFPLDIDQISKIETQEEEFAIKTLLSTDNGLESKITKTFPIPEIEVSLDSQEKEENYSPDIKEDYLTEKVLPENVKNDQSEQKEMLDNQDLNISEISKDDKVDLEELDKKQDQMGENPIFVDDVQSNKKTCLISESNLEDLKDADIKKDPIENVERLEEDEVTFETILRTDIKYSEIYANSAEEITSQERRINIEKETESTSETFSILDKEMSTVLAVTKGCDETKIVNLETFASKTDVINVDTSKEQLSQVQESTFFDEEIGSFGGKIHLISPLTTSEQLDDISSDLPFLDEESESIFKMSSSSAPFWFPDEDIIRISPDLKQGNPDRKYQKQSLATLLEERETENEESYQSLSEKYDNLTFLDANKIKNFVEIFNERKSKETMTEQHEELKQIPDLEQIVCPTDQVDFERTETVVDQSEMRNEEIFFSDNGIKEQLTEKLDTPFEMTKSCMDENDTAEVSEKMEIETEIEANKNIVEEEQEIVKSQSQIELLDEKVICKETNLECKDEIVIKSEFKEVKQEAENEIVISKDDNCKEDKITKSESETNQPSIAEMPLEMDMTVEINFQKQKTEGNEEALSKPIEKDQRRIHDFSELSRRDFLLMSTGLSEKMSLTFKADENPETCKAGADSKFQNQNVSTKSDPTYGMDLHLWSRDFEESKERFFHKSSLFFKANCNFRYYAEVDCVIKYLLGLY